MTKNTNHDSLIKIENKIKQEPMMRTIIDIPDTQIDLLSNLVEQENISRAELIRRAISEYLARYQVKQTDAFGLWKDKQVDGVEYQNKLREEW